MPARGDHQGSGSSSRTGPWDISPSLPIDRMRSVGTVGVGPLKTIQLTSPITGASRSEIVNRPAPALILRRYTEGWRRPDDRKVNPWDLNEPDPTDAGTMGTIPGPTLECEIGDTLVVHFRNLDMRTVGAGWGRADPPLRAGDARALAARARRLLPGEVRRLVPAVAARPRPADPGRRARAVERGRRDRPVQAGRSRPAGRHVHVHVGGARGGERRGAGSTTTIRSTT